MTDRNDTQETQAMVPITPEPPKEPKKKKTGPRLTPEMVELIAAVAAETAVEKYKEERKRSAEMVRDRRYNNTKLLFRSYRSLADYNKNTIFDIAQLAEEKGNPELLEAVGLLGESRQVECIRDRVAFTRVAMENVEIALEVYKRWCEKSPKPEVQRRWRVLYKMYLSDTELTPQEVADEEHISLSQVYEDINNAAKDMEKRFFGLDTEIFE